jgi:succinyl-CoA synthetase beta subunit
VKIHEFQAKELLRRYGVPVSWGAMAETPEAVREIVSQLGTNVVIKAQIHAGGRGAAGGILFADTPEEAYRKAKNLIGMNLVTEQTGPEGKRVQKVLVEKATPVHKEIYLALVIDRSRGRDCPVFMASGTGGMDIEAVVQKVPKALEKVAVHPVVGFSPFQARKLAYGLGLESSLRNQLADIARNIYNLFVQNDALLVEINPLAIDDQGNLMALDAKIQFDEDALFRHPELKTLRDMTEEDPMERKSFETGLRCIALKGNVGCIVNGAGLAMATMDLIKLAGGEPANFLDIGGGASPEQIEQAFRILSSHPKVKVILVNIFGGILRCDWVAKGLIEAAKKTAMNLPMVIRLQGTNDKEGRRILKGANFHFEVAEGLFEAAQKAVSLS